MLKKSISVVFILLATVLLFADEATLYDSEIVTYDFANENPETINAMLFEYGYSALLENKCKGAVLYFGEGDKYLAGYSSSNAPLDYCSNIYPDTIVCSAAIPTKLAIVCSKLLNDTLSASALKIYPKDALIMVILFTPEENMVVEPYAYYMAKKNLEDTAFGCGINKNELYKTFVNLGVNEQQIVESIIKKEITSKDIITNILETKYELKSNSSGLETYNEKMIKMLIFISLTIFIIILSIFVIYIISKISKKKNR